MINRLLLFTLILSHASFLPAESIVCQIKPEVGFSKPLSSKFFKLEKSMALNETNDFSLKVNGEFEGIPLQNIGIVRSQKGRIILGASLEKHPIEEGFQTHVVAIPSSHISEYKFHILFSEIETQCPKTKSFYINFGT